MIKKFIQYASGNFLALILGFISSPIITRLILPEEMGKFSLFNTVTSLLFLFVMIGTDQAYVRFYNGGNGEGKKCLLRKCVSISLIVAFGTSLGILCFYKPLSNYIIGEISFKVCILLIINIITSVLQRFSLLELRMSMKAKTYSAMNVWHKLSYILMVFAVYIWLKNNSLVLMIATVASNLLCYLACVILERKVWFHLRKCTSVFKTRELIIYGFPFVFSNAINWIFEYMDRMSIRYFCDFTEIGIYSAASTIVSLLTSCQLAFTAFWVPIAYEKYENDPKCNDFFVKMNRVVSYGMIIIAIGMVAGKDLIIFLLGDQYRNAMYIFPFLTFMPIMYTISETTVMGINFKKKTKAHIVVAGISAICNLAGNTVLVPMYGAKGAAISTGLSYVVFFAVRTIISLKLYKVEYKLKELCLALAFLCVLTVFSSFHSFDITIVIFTVVAVFATSILYRDVVFDIICYLKKMCRRRKMK